MASGSLSTANLLTPGESLWGFPTTQNPYVAAVLFETILYGIYLGLCLLCVYLLLSRRTSIGYIFLTSAFVLFCFATGSITYSYVLLFRYILNGSLTFRQLYPKGIVYVVCNAISDSILLYRCYIIWNHNRRVVIVPAILLVVITGCGIAFDGTTMELFRWADIYLSMAIGFNILVTSLTAGRIWWTIRNVRDTHFLQSSNRSQQLFIFLVETGLIYPAYMCIDFGFRNNSYVSILMCTGIIPIVVIVPTLILVRVALHSPESTSSQRAAGRVPPAMQPRPQNSHTQLALPSLTASRATRASIDWEDLPRPVVAAPMQDRSRLESNNQILYESREGSATPTMVSGRLDGRTLEHQGL
ncbi:hypothetical protein BDN72DRAFT_839606 [Pluteus cervinus]|uniref:Uncharacterized protein n=1 Tax=Pluteus cervinus TaxID=181527 RepID=A0ACD3AWR4_9AGAR|nr:hypothetical protein BDN72DRAFT_839606 [Pluteus cervinus]